MDWHGCHVRHVQQHEGRTLAVHQCKLRFISGGHTLGLSTCFFPTFITVCNFRVYSFSPSFSLPV